MPTVALRESNACPESLRVRPRSVHEQHRWMAGDMPRSRASASAVQDAVAFHKRVGEGRKAGKKRRRKCVWTSAETDWIAKARPQAGPSHARRLRRAGTASLHRYTTASHPANTTHDVRSTCERKALMWGNAAQSGKGGKTQISRKDRKTEVTEMTEKTGKEKKTGKQPPASHKTVWAKELSSVQSTILHTCRHTEMGQERRDTRRHRIWDREQDNGRLWFVQAG